MFDNIPLTLTLGQTDPAPTGDAPPTSQNVDPSGNGGGDNTSTTTPSDEPLGPTNSNNNNQTDPWSGLLSFLPFILIIVVFWFILFGSQRKEKKKRQQMLAELSKNDRVVTIGGVIGTVVEVRENEVVLKVDESSNTRMRFSRNAIQSLVAEKED
jgi:preprotein translocase subunit YajC